MQSRVIKFLSRNLKIFQSFEIAWIEALNLLRKNTKFGLKKFMLFIAKIIKRLTFNNYTLYSQVASSFNRDLRVLLLNRMLTFLFCLY